MDWAGMAFAKKHACWLLVNPARAAVAALSDEMMCTFFVRIEEAAICAHVWDGAAHDYSTRLSEIAALNDDSGAPSRSGTRGRSLPLVQATAETLRGLILTQEAGAQIGSLPELANKLDVGIVTVQQAARILEHEGLLEVRRGPGGGYFGARPDGAALERSVAAYLRVHGAAYRDVSDMMPLLDTELMPAAACCEDPELRRELKNLLPRIGRSHSPDARIAIEEDLHRIVFRMVQRPLLELLARVTTQVARSQGAPPLFPGADGEAFWKQSRSRIIQAILERDPGLATFEAVRYRQAMLTRAAAQRGEAVHWARLLDHVDAASADDGGEGSAPAPSTVRSLRR